QEEKELASKGNSIVYVVQDNKIISLIGVNDIIRTETKEVLRNLLTIKIEPIMVTGDNKDTAKVIAKELGITKIIAGVLPKEKSNIVKQLQKENKFVMMCGDGINDSPALAISNIGVSVNSG